MEYFFNTSQKKWKLKCLSLKNLALHFTQRSKLIKEVSIKLHTIKSHSESILILLRYLRCLLLFIIDNILFLVLLFIFHRLLWGCTSNKFKEISLNIQSLLCIWFRVDRPLVNSRSTVN